MMPSSAVLKMTGIGDLHLDGPLRHYVDDANRVILNEVRSVIDASLSVGYGSVVALLGDLFHSYQPSVDNGLSALVELFAEYPKTTFIVLSGNHDVDSIEANPKNALRHLEVLVRTKLLKNVILSLDHPLNLSEVVPEGSPLAGLRLLPFPHTSIDRKRLNLMHVEVKGSTSDNGFTSTSEFDPKSAVCLVGHLHTRQSVRNVFYPGTLYQTTFGESPTKFYARVRWDTSRPVSEASIKEVQFAPRYRLLTEVVNTLKEYRALCRRLASSDEGELFKVVVNRDLVLPDSPFSDFPQVVKTNPFKTESELRAVLQEDIELAQSEAALKPVDLNSALGTWMDSNNIDSDLQSRVVAKLNDLVSKSPITIKE